MRCGRTSRCRPASSCRITRCTATPFPRRRRSGSRTTATHLHVAFKCDDPDPSGIKTSITRRDNIFQDDWVGLSLDALGTGQVSYHMMVNPSGVQLDMLNSVAGDEDPRPTGSGTVPAGSPIPDMPWSSACPCRAFASRAASTRANGHPVLAAREPLGGVGVVAGVGARRVGLRAPRVAPLRQPGAASGARSPAVRNLQPHRARESPARWAPGDGRGDVGLSAKVGLTSTITLDATVNPDFSQVESDSFQVEVNQRFPVFFAEKRPFFMEGAGVFALAGAGGGDNTLRTGIHTRRIIDPIFGAKVTGSVGRVTFGTLSAADEAAGRAAPADSPEVGKNRLFNIARAQHSLGPSNYVGAPSPTRPLRGTYNRVVGADFKWRLTDTQRIEAFALASRSRVAAEGDPSGGFGAQVNYNYSTRQWVAAGSFEHYDEDFEMATAFMNRVGVTGAWAYVERNLYPDTNRLPWLHRFLFFSFTQGGHDHFAGGNEFVEVAGVRMFFTRQGFLNVDYQAGFEHWAGERFKRGRPRLHGEVQLFRWLALERRVWRRPGAVLYDPVNPFQGWSRDFNVGTTLQPSGRLSQTLSYQRVVFERADTRAPVYDLDIVNARTTYQFTRATRCAIAQHDSSRKRVLTDFLASDEPRPGTVVAAGVRVAARAARVRQRRLGARSRGISHHPARRVLQGVIPAPRF